MDPRIGSLKNRHRSREPPEKVWLKRKGPAQAKGSGSNETVWVKGKGLGYARPFQGPLRPPKGYPPFREVNTRTGVLPWGLSQGGRCRGGVSWPDPNQYARGPTPDAPTPMFTSLGGGEGRLPGPGG
jgi:hypothetical protein